MTRSFTLSFLAMALISTALSAQAPAMGPDPCGAGPLGRGPGFPPPMEERGGPGPIDRKPEPGRPPMLRFLNLTPTQDQAVKAILAKRRPEQLSRNKVLDAKGAALMAGLEDPVLSEAQLRALQAAESEARLQVVLAQRAAFLEIHAVLSPDQQAKALRLGLKQRKEREARLELEAERGN